MAFVLSLFILLVSSFPCLGKGCASCLEDFLVISTLILLQAVKSMFIQYE